MIQKPSEKEQEYFQQQELARLKQQREESASKIVDEEKNNLKELHWMHCPKCGMEMSEVKFRDVLIDTCFSCGGMYLDKGEIDKILESKETGNFQKIRSFLLGNKEE